MRSAPLFQVAIMPFRSLVTIASSEDSTMAARRSAANSLLRRFSISLRSQSSTKAISPTSSSEVEKKTSSEVASGQLSDSGGTNKNHVTTTERIVASIPGQKQP